VARTADTRHAATASETSLARLRVAKTYSPTQDGAKRFARRFGEQLVCVRQRLNAAGTVRHTTVELLIESTPIAQRARQVIAVRLAPTDKPSRKLLLACGAEWRPKEKYWLVPQVVAKNLGLLHLRVPIQG
jgi:hypothetical protein